MEENKVAGKSGSDNYSSDKGGVCSPMHWACCIVPILTLTFWVGGILSLILAWLAGNGLILGKADAFWYLNALALGVLAIGGRGKRIGACRRGGCCSGVCGGCKDGVCK